MALTEALLGVSFVMSVIAVLGCLALATEISKLRGELSQASHAAHVPVAPSAVELIAANSRVRLAPGADAILVAALPGCSACDALLRMPIADEMRGLPFAVIVAARRSDANELANSAGLDPAIVMADEQGVFLRSAGVTNFPSAVLIEAGRFVRVAPVASWSDVVGVAGSLRRTPLELARPLEGSA